MEDARTYMESTAPATEGLFKLLNQYRWQKMRAFVALTKSQSRGELEENKKELGSTDVAREVIAGSILQIAYVGIKKYSVVTAKSPRALHFESEINRFIRENPSRARVKDEFSLPAELCVGREIGHLPLGIIVSVGRNQYNHFYEEKRLSRLNEVVFNYLHAMWPEPKNGISFDLRPSQLFSYSILAAIGWLDSSRGLGYGTYKRDMSNILQVEF